MREAAIFFGGALLGALLAGASGLDFFASARPEVVQLEKAERELAELREGARSHGDALASTRAEISRRTEALAVARDEKRGLADRVKALSGERDAEVVSRKRVESELSALRSDLARSEGRCAQVERWLEAFFTFSSPRREEDAQAAAEFLRSEAPAEAKLAFVFQLRAVNPHVLAALPSRPAPRPAVIPASASQEEDASTVEVRYHEAGAQ